MRGLGFLRSFVALPLPIMLALSVGSMSLLGILTMLLLFRQSIAGSWIILLAIGVVLALGVIGIYTLIQKRRAARRGREFQEEVTRLPGSGDKAQDASFARAFEEGLNKYAQTGKKFWEQPWYLVIGEPASGKTKAIKRSIRFDPLLTNHFQGSGGTQNMDWWFAQDAVILDTAGKMAFPENRDRVSTSWPELLKRLKKCRPIAPINGVLLFVSAESLQKKTVEQIQEEARMANMRLREINRDLGVRFPVWVIVSKSDTITGFREMIAEMTSAEEQHQILGWSNPLNISSEQSDQPFDARRVREHIDEVARKIEHLRRSLLQNPTPRNIALDPDARRLDEVDELYQLPEALRRIGYRLQLYLEEAMSQGVSGAPLFMRGIYFTSAEQKGDVLDLLLAEELDIPVSELRRPVGEDGAIDDDPSRDYGTPYFLKDLFEQKIFEEKGLVTAQRSVGRAEARRRAWTIGGIAACALLVTVLGWWASTALEKKMGARSKFWKSAATVIPNSPTVQSPADAARFRLVAPSPDGSFVYFGDIAYDLPQDPGVGGRFQLIPEDARETIAPDDPRLLPDNPGKTLGYQIPLRTFDYATVHRVPEGQPIASAFFWPAAKISGDVFSSQVDAHFAALHNSILGPAIGAARSMLTMPTLREELTPEQLARAPQAIADLLRIEVARGSKTAARIPDLASLVRFCMQPEDGAAHAFDTQLGMLQQVVNQSFDASLGFADARSWPSPRVLRMPGADAAIDEGVEWFIASQLAQSAAHRTTGPWKALSDLQEALRAYKQAEDMILNLSFDVEDAAEYEKQWASFRSAWQDLTDAHERTMEALEQVRSTTVAGTSLADVTPSQALEVAMREVVGRPRDNYDLLLRICLHKDGEDFSPTQAIDQGTLIQPPPAPAPTAIERARSSLIEGWRTFAASAGREAIEHFAPMRTELTYLVGDAPLAEAPPILARFEAVQALARAVGVDAYETPRAFAEATTASDPQRPDPIAQVPQRLQRAAVVIDADPVLEEDEDRDALAAILSPADPSSARLAIDRLALATTRYRLWSIMVGVLDALAIDEQATAETIARAIASRADAGLIFPIRREAIPFTPVTDGSSFDIAYHPQSAHDASVAIDAMRDRPEDAPAPLSAASVDARLTRARRAIEDYADDARRYWSSGVFADLAVEPSGLSLGEIREIAASDGTGQTPYPGQINDRLVAFCDTVLSSLTTLEVDDELREAPRLIRRLYGARLGDEGAEALEAWAAIFPGDDDFAPLARRLRALARAGELAPYLPQEVFRRRDADLPPDWNYWANLLSALLTRCADASEAELRALAGRIGQNLSRFPFARESTQTLSPDEAHEVAASLAQFAGPGTAPAGEYPPEIDDLIARLLGSRVERPDAPEHTDEVVRVLIGSDPSKPDPLRFEVGLTSELFARPSATITLRDGRRTLIDEVRDLGASQFKPLGTVSAGAGSIELAFEGGWRAGSGDRPFALLRALLDRATFDEQEGIWKIPLKVGAGGAQGAPQNLSFIVGVRIANDDDRGQILRDLVDNDDWPR